MPDSFLPGWSWVVTTCTLPYAATIPCLPDFMDTYLLRWVYLLFTAFLTYSYLAAAARTYRFCHRCHLLPAAAFHCTVHRLHTTCYLPTTHAFLPHLLPPGSRLRISTFTTVPACHLHVLQFCLYLPVYLLPPFYLHWISAYVFCLAAYLTFTCLPPLHLPSLRFLRFLLTTIYPAPVP